jgi:hypothetical protein
MSSTTVVPNFSTVRARAYLHKLPLFTRVSIIIIALCWVLGLQSVWDIRGWGALIPDKLNFATCECLAGDRMQMECGMQKDEELTGCSIPNKHLPIHTPQLHPCDTQCAGAHALDGAVRA